MASNIIITFQTWEYPCAVPGDAYRPLDVVSYRIFQLVPVSDIYYNRQRRWPKPDPKFGSPTVIKCRQRQQS